MCSHCILATQSAYQRKYLASCQSVIRFRDVSPDAGTEAIPLDDVEIASHLPTHLPAVNEGAHGKDESDVLRKHFRFHFALGLRRVWTIH